MRVLVTGGTGFIGSQLVEALLAQGDEVRCLVRDTRRLGWISGLPSVTIAPGGMADPGADLLALATGADPWAWFTGRPGYFSRGKVREAAGHWLCETGRARRQLGIVPSVGLTRGAAVTVKWYRDTGTSAAGFSTRLRSSLGCRRRPLPRSRLLVWYAMRRGDGEVI